MKPIHAAAVVLSSLVIAPAFAPAAVTWRASVNDSAGGHAALHPALVAHAQAAGRRWSDHFYAADVSVDVRIDITPVPTGRGDGTSAVSAFVGTHNGINVFEQGLAAELRTGVDPNDSLADVHIRIDPSYLSDFLWLDPDPASRTAAVPADRIDAMSFFLHEIGHAIAFNGWRHWSSAELPAGNYQSTFDAHVATGPDGLAYFTGPGATALYGSPVPLTTDNIFHLGNLDPAPGADLVPDLMNGVAFFFGNRYDISALDIAILADTGLPVHMPEPSLLPLLLTALLPLRRGRRHRRPCA